MLQMWFEETAEKEARYDIGEPEYKFTPEELEKIKSFGYFK
jgi:hypothetical protein